MIAQLCEYTKNHQIVYFQGMNFVLCELHFNRSYFRVGVRLLVEHLPSMCAQGLVPSTKKEKLILKSFHDF
jgi:hypothetical protein